MPQIIFEPWSERPRRIPVVSIKGIDQTSTDGLKLLVYLEELERQAEIYGSCLADAVAAAGAPEGATETWRHLQAAMFAAIVVNRLLTSDGSRRWPGGTAEQAMKAAGWRVAELQRLLGLPADRSATPLYNVGKVRNSLEHIDARLDWALNSSRLMCVSDWYLSDGWFITAAAEADPADQPAGLRAFYPEGGIALFGDTTLDLFELDLDMLKLRHNIREAKAELLQEIRGRLPFGGGRLTHLVSSQQGDRRVYWQAKRREVLETMAPPVPVDGGRAVWLERQSEPAVGQRTVPADVVSEPHPGAE